MRRYAALALILLLLIPVAAESTGTLSIPVVFGSLTAGVQNLSLFDTTFNAVRDYINSREVTTDVAANRPAASVKGRYYLSTDLNGGTFYVDTGTAWLQVAGPVTGAVADQFTGLTLSNNATNPSSTLAIAVGAATSDDAVIANRILMSLTSAFTKTTGAFTAGTGNGCLDSGTVAASTWYHAFLIQRVDTNATDILCSTSATAPTMPTNFTKKRRLGAVFTDASIAINFFTQRARSFRWATVPTLNIADTAVNTTSAITATATTPNGISTEAILNGCLTAAAANIAVYFSALTEADQAPSATAAPLGTLGLGNAFQCAPLSVWTDTSRQFRFRSSAAGIGVRAGTVGWTDPVTP